MTREDIIRMAREAGMPSLSLIDIGYLEKFAALVAAAEREACSAIVEAEAMAYAEPTWSLRIVNRIHARSKE